MEQHSHTAKVLEWGLNAETNYVPKLYGCTQCSETFTTSPSSGTISNHEHTEYVEGCFGCKLPTLQMNTGDATSGIPMTKKKLNNELGLYRSARAQGIQPKSTKTADIQRAIEISNLSGKAYDASKI